MSSNQPDSTDSSSAKRTYQPGLYAAVILFLALAILWYDLGKTKNVQIEQAEQTQQLAAALETAQSELTAARKELDFFKTGDSRAASKEKVAKAVSVITTPVEEPETMFLQEPSVSQTDSGLVALFGFTPDDNTELPEQITLVIRVPSDSEATIQSLKPVEESSYSNVEVIVDAKGKLGMIEGSPSDLSALTFELTVSESVKALVRGSKGIKAFEMDITPEGCTVRKL